MRSLFVKVFLWFWLAMLTMGVSLVVAQRQWAPPPSLPNSGQMAAYATEAARLLAQGERRELARWLAELNREAEPRFLLLDDAGRSVTGRPLPPHLRERVTALLESDGAQRDRRVAVERIAADGRAAHLVAVLPPQHRLQDMPMWLRGLIVLAVSGLVSLLLAAYLSRPLRQLRHAAQRLAGGDLQARVPLSRGGDEIAELGLDFNLMAERLQHLLEAQAQLLRDVSHELRSPLNRLQVALELARRDAGEAAAQSLNRIELEAERLNDLIAQVLALSRLETGAAAPARKRLDVAALVQEIVDDAEFESGSQRLVYRGPESALAAADPGLLRSAIENVVRNAVRHTAGAAPVEVMLEPGDPLRVYVRDHGEGIPAADLERVFEPFVRVSSARERDSGGYGLGLAIARRALRLHGGEISARNVAEGGLEVCLEIPQGQLAG